MKKVVLIHGFLGHDDMWNHILPETDAEVYTPRLAGHGNHHLFEQPTLSAYAHDVLQQIDFNLEDELELVGHSMGGYVALEIAKQFPLNCAKLGLFHSTAQADSELKKQDRLRAMEAAKEHQALYAANLIDGLFHEPQLHSKDIEEQLAKIASMQAENTIQALTAMRNREESISFLTNQVFPIWYFNGNQDKVLPIERMQEEWNQLPHALVVQLDQCGHMGHIEQHEAAKKFLQDFCNHFTS